LIEVDEAREGFNWEKISPVGVKGLESLDFKVVSLNEVGDKRLVL
jgi:hypothetical protein